MFLQFKIMKRILFLFLMIVAMGAKSQVYQVMPQYGYQAPRMMFDSTLQIPTTCGVPTLKSLVGVNKKSAIAFDSCNNRFYTYNPSTLTWSQITGGGGGSDTAKVIIAQVRNVEATTLNIGEVVYLKSSTGNIASVKRASNRDDSTSSRTLGVVRESIAPNATGYVTTQGQVEKMNLGSYAEGDILWLDSIAGGVTKTKPIAPFHGVFIGIVERANNGNGIAYIKCQNGYELAEIHDVRITSPINGQILVYSDTQKIWKNRTFSGGGSTGVNGLNGTTNIGIGGTITQNTTINTDTASTNVFRIGTDSLPFNQISLGANNISMPQLDRSQTNYSDCVVMVMDTTGNKNLIKTIPISKIAVNVPTLVGKITDDGSTCTWQVLSNTTNVDFSIECIGGGTYRLWSDKTTNPNSNMFNFNTWFSSLSFYPYRVNNEFLGQIVYDGFNNDFVTIKAFGDDGSSTSGVLNASFEIRFYNSSSSGDIYKP